MKRTALARGPVRLSRKTSKARKPAVAAPKRVAGTKTGDWSDETRATVQRRSGGHCETRLIDCTGLATDLHHRQPRRTRLHTVENALAVCRSCHREVHRSPEISRRAGWVVPTWDDPATVPVRIAGRLVWLTDAGKYVGEAAA